MKTRPDLAALALCGVIVLACTVLAVTGKPIPDFLPLLGMTLAGVGGGAALPASPKQPEKLEVGNGTVTARASGSTAARPVPAYPLDEDPPTGYFARIAAGGQP